jgi:hypothetical protein
VTILAVTGLAVTLPSTAAETAGEAVPAAAEADAEVAAWSGAELQAARADDNRAKDSNWEVKGLRMFCTHPFSLWNTSTVSSQAESLLNPF